jgi:hypothetical protein
MKNYAVLDSENIVTNIIVAGSLEVAEATTSQKCIYATDLTGAPYIGYAYSDGVFSGPEPVIADFGPPDEDAAPTP